MYATLPSHAATGGVPLAAATDRPDVDVIDLGPAGVTVSEGFDKTLMVPKEQGTVVIREDVTADRDAIDSFFKSSDIEEPCR